MVNGTHAHTQAHAPAFRAHRTEMTKAGLIDEMMNDALDDALDTENMEVMRCLALCAWD